MTGGKHITFDDMFKSAKNVSCNAEVVEREKDRKWRVEYHARCEAALPVLDPLEKELENVAAQLTEKELEVLLCWKGVPVLKWEMWHTDGCCSNNLQTEGGRMT